jgi:hypothetical protein
MVMTMVMVLLRGNRYVLPNKVDVAWGHGAPWTRARRPKQSRQVLQNGDHYRLTGHSNTTHRGSGTKGGVEGELHVVHMRATDDPQRSLVRVGEGRAGEVSTHHHTLCTHIGFNITSHRSTATRTFSTANFWSAGSQDCATTTPTASSTYDADELPDSEVGTGSRTCFSTLWVTKHKRM